jgi:hypothetical protein
VQIAFAFMFVFCSYRGMTTAPSTLDPTLRVPPLPPRLMICGTSSARRDGPAWGIAHEAMLAFTLGLAVAWALAEAALLFGGHP